jgi:hypothetical protein
MNFRSVSENHIQSNIFEIFKIPSSKLVQLNCWTKICEDKSKCNTKSLCADLNNIDDSKYYLKENLIFKETSIRILVEDPYVLQHGTGRFIRTDENSRNNIIGK